MKHPMLLRPAIIDDLPQVREIYGEEVLYGNSSFEDEVPDVGEMRRRYQGCLERDHPYLVVEMEGRVAGFAYCRTYNARPGYRFTVENSVYTAAWARRRGVGAVLLRGLIEESTSRNFRMMVSIITHPGNEASITLHEKAGFVHVGTLAGVGYKHGRWFDVYLMQRVLGDGAGTAP